MTDRELLELAAKAEGLKPPMPMHGPGLTWGHGWWNPLVDSGEALELAVRLKLSIFLRPYRVEILGWTEAAAPLGYTSPPPPKVLSMEAYVDDPLAATRRAIVRAAAELGRSMK